MSSSSSSEPALVPAAVDERFLARFETSFLGGMQAVLDDAGISRQELEAAMRSAGEIRTVLADGAEAGSVWIELRGPTLHVHALLLDEAFRGRGLGRAVLELLDDEFADRADAIELAVQHGNAPAERLYEAAGFTDVESEHERVGFRVLRRPVSRTRT